MRARLRASATALALCAAALACLPAAAATLYKWTDAQGRIQYSDKPPKDFKGEVTPITTDLEPTPQPVAPGAAPAAAPAATDAKAVPEPPDLAAQRRARRAQLELRLRRAQDNLEAARAALAAAGSPEPEERQVVQQRVKGEGNAAAATPIRNADPTQGSMTGGGMHGMGARSNCRQAVDAGGKKTTICPAVLPSSAYYERIARLEEAVRNAEQALAVAEEAYRRGRD